MNQLTPEDDATRSALPPGEAVELPEEQFEVEDTEDGGAIIRLPDAASTQERLAHFANIVEVVDRAALSTTVTDLLEKIERDKESRKKRDELYEEGLRRTGLGNDAPGGASFAGANKVVHPMLVEACVDFSARVMKELFPPAGPVKTKILGRVDKTKAEKAERKAAFMNWQLTEQMPEFRGELEQLSTQLPLGGVQYLKLMWNPTWKRPTAEFIAVDDILLPFAATNFYTAERKTHRQYLTRQEYEKRVANGMYRDVDLPTPQPPEFSAASQANDKIEGRTQSNYNEDGLRLVYEVCVWLDIEAPGEGLRPYILSVDFSTREAMSLYRNWEPDDDQFRELDWIVEFPFIPWRGAYPIGLTHLIGGLSGAATGALRALLDSAHIQNAPTLLKLKGGPDGQTLTLQPTQVAEVEGGSLVDDIRKLVMAVPFNGPSSTLFQLLGFIVDAGKGVVQTSFEKLADANPHQPVGTTLALIEQGMVVFSSIHSRLHNAMARTFKVLHRINSAYLDAETLAAYECGLELDAADFDGPMDVVPVSDPQVFSETQRFAQVQALMQRAAVVPQMYDARRVEEMFLDAMKLPDDVLVPKQGQDDVDPVSENVAAAMGRPVYVLPKQDHIAHLKAHMAFLQSPLLGRNPVIAQTYLLPMVNHLRDHILNHYLVQAHEGVEAAQHAGIISDNADQEVQVIARIQQAIEHELAGLAQLMPQLAQAAQQFAPKPPQDNSMAVAQLGAQVQTQAIQQREAADQRRAQIDAAKLADKAEDRAAALRREELQQGHEDARTHFETAARVGMNTADNETAMRLAAAEIASGERVDVSTGTGINPGTR